MNLTYQNESLVRFYADAINLLPEHWDEVGTMKGARDFKPDVKTYLEIEAKGRIICVTARDDGALAGYIVGIIGPDLHAQGGRICITDIYRVLPRAREQGVGHALFDYYENTARARGCSLITNRQKLKDGHPTATDEFFKELGYQKTEVVWIRSLK